MSKNFVSGAVSLCVSMRYKEHKTCCFFYRDKKAALGADSHESYAFKLQSDIKAVEKIGKKGLSAKKNTVLVGKYTEGVLGKLS